MQGSSERPVPVCDASASASAMASHSNMHLPSPIAICNAPTGQSKPPLTSHITQLWRAAHCQDVPAVAQEIRRHGDTQALLGPRQHRGVRGRLQTGLETNSALSAYAACNCVGSAEMPAQSRLWPWASQALMTVLEISITLHPPTIALLYLYRPAFHP